jgi:hypothetical protein
VGSGKGRGSALMFIVAGAMNCAVACIGLAYTPLRRVDLDLPDRDSVSVEKQTQ